MGKGVMDILVKLSDTKLEIGSSVSIIIFNSYSMKVRICLLLACSASVEHNSFLLAPIGWLVTYKAIYKY